MSASIRSALQGLVADGTILPEAELERWRTAPGGEGTPEAVLAPSTEEEMAAVLGRAGEEGWRVLPAGLGQWLHGGGPTLAEVVISTRRMTAIREYEPADLTFTAGAGLSLSALRESTQPYRQWLPLDPPGGVRGSLGAVAATGMSGSLRHHYGTPRDHVLGLTMVSGDGKILRWGGRVVKNVAGFDLTRLSIGSWGCLGVITSVSARLFPVPGADRTLIFRAADPRILLESARAMALSPLPLAAVELVDPLPPHAPGKGEGGQADPVAALVIRLLGSGAQVAAMADRVTRELSGNLGHPQAIEGEVSAGFHNHLGKRAAEGDLVARLCLLPSELGTLLVEAERLRALVAGPERGGPSADTSASGQGGATLIPDTGFKLSAHVGAGVLRVSVSGLLQGGGDPGPWITTLRSIRDRLEESGGSLILCRAPDPVLADVGFWGDASGEQRLMAGLKAQLDPHHILAPGRLGL